MKAAELNTWNAGIAHGNIQPASVGLVSPAQLASLCKKGAILGAIPAPFAYVASIVPCQSHWVSDMKMGRTGQLHSPSSSSNPGKSTMTSDQVNESFENLKFISVDESPKKSSLSNPLASHQISRNVSLDSNMSSLSKQLRPGFFQAVPLDPPTVHMETLEKQNLTPISNLREIAKPLQSADLSPHRDSKSSDCSASREHECFSESPDLIGRRYFTEKITAESPEKGCLDDIEIEDPLEAFKIDINNEASDIAVFGEGVNDNTRELKEAKCTNKLHIDFNLPFDDNFGDVLFLEDLDEASIELETEQASVVCDKDPTRQTGELYEIFEEFAKDDAECDIVKLPKESKKFSKLEEQEYYYGAVKIDDHLVRCLPSNCKQGADGSFLPGIPMNDSNIVRNGIERKVDSNAHTSGESFKINISARTGTSLQSSFGMNSTCRNKNEMVRTVSTVRRKRSRCSQSTAAECKKQAQKQKKIKQTYPTAAPKHLSILFPFPVNVVDSVEKDESEISQIVNKKRSNENCAILDQLCDVRIDSDNPDQKHVLCHFLIGKSLTQTDVSRLGRIILPRGSVENALPRVNDARGRCLTLWHKSGRWNLPEYCIEF